MAVGTGPRSLVHRSGHSESLAGWSGRTLRSKEPGGAGPARRAPGWVWLAAPEDGAGAAGRSCRGLHDLGGTATGPTRRSQVAGPRSTPLALTGTIPHISRAYARIVASLENRAPATTLNSAFFAHARGDA